MSLVAPPPHPDPDTERRRVVRLRRLAVLDTGPEPVFDALVRIAAAVCGKPIALLSLVDENRQWFKANQGLDGVSETPREAAFCDHAIRGDAVMAVDDATRDARFSDNPLVTGPLHLRFYAGAPIAMPGGERIGTLCVLDREPGTLGAQQQAALRDLAEVARWALLPRERQHMLGLVLQNLPCGLSVFDADLRLLAHNRQFQTLLGFPDPLFATPDPQFRDFIRFNAERGEYGAGDPERITRHILEQAREAQPHAMQRQRPGGAWLDVRGAPLPGGGFVTTYTDISAAKAAERALRESEERQKRALDAARLALFDLDLATGKVYLSENWSVFLGGLPVPTVATLQEFEHLVPQEERGPLREAMVEALKGRVSRYAMEHRVRRRDGTWMWIRSEGGVTLRDVQGRALQATGTLQDITARKSGEAELARAAAITRATLESTADGILVMDAQREVLLHNRRFLAMWNVPPGLAGARREELEGFAREQLRDPAAFDRQVAVVEAAPNGETFDLLELRDGRLFERYSRPIALDGGMPGRVWSFRDVTARRAAEAEVRHAKEAAEAANRAKSEFLDNVSHEIRTPLNGVLGLTRLLLAEDLSTQQRKYVQLAESSASSLLELINDLLDLGKIESGRMDLEDHPFRLDEVVSHLGELYRLRAAEKGLRFVLDVDPTVPQAVSGDAGRLRQVLNNLLSNAFKFTSHGEFGLVVGRADSGRGTDMLRFTVYDTGIGIPAEVQQRLFTRFTQADSSTSRKYGGTGLGLAIVKQLCEMMGGSVLLQSEPGRGASFRCELPLRPVEAIAPAAGAAAAAAKATRPDFATRVLVAEDNATNQVVVRGLLAQAGYTRVTRVGDGQEALDAAAANEFDLVLMDCRMPRMDGYEASRRLRAAGFTQPIIALTANAAAGERERCLAWGMNDYLSKPIDPGRLAHVLAEWTGNAHQPGSGDPAPELAGDAMFDRHQSLKRLGGDHELLAVALSSFRKHAPAVLQSATESLAAGSAVDLHRHLHSLAGSAAMVGAHPLHRLAQQLEMQAGANALHDVEAQMPALWKLFDRFIAESAHW